MLRQEPALKAARTFGSGTFGQFVSAARDTEFEIEKRIGAEPD